MVSPIWVGSPNHRARGGNVRHIDLHWMAGFLAGTDAVFQRPGGTSTHYGIQDSRVHQYVDERRAAPGTGQNYAIRHGISIEHAGGWTLADGSLARPTPETHETSAQLCADISRRHGLGTLEVGRNLYGHNHWVATMCPGTLDLGWIARRTNQILGAGGDPGPQGPGGGGSAAPGFGAFPARNLYGHAWVVRAQNKAMALGYSLDPWGADGLDGARTQAVVADIQKRGNIHIDGIYGPRTDEVADALLSPTTGGSGSVPAPPFPLSEGSYFGPRYPLSNVRSVSGYHGNREHLRRYQQRMLDRGWRFAHGADGLYGDATRAVTRAFQAEKGLTVDGLIGKQTWRAAWEAPIT